MPKTRLEHTVTCAPPHRTIIYNIRPNAPSTKPRLLEEGKSFSPVLRGLAFNRPCIIVIADDTLRRMGTDDGTSPQSQDFRDDALVADITPNVMRVLKSCRFFEELDDHLCPVDASNACAKCQGYFQISSLILRSHGFDDEELADVFLVLQSQGGFCDCEVLYNVAELNRLKTTYWHARVEGRELPTNHKPGT